MGDAFQNRLDRWKCYPTGGDIAPPDLRDYMQYQGSLASGGVAATPYPSLRQGMGWVFQILPYVEMQDTYDIYNNASDQTTVTSQLQKISLPFIACPTRGRAGTRHPTTGAVLIDYAAATPGVVVAGNPYTAGTVDPQLAFWGGRTAVSGASGTQVPANAVFEGVIVRTPWVTAGVPVDASHANHDSMGTSSGGSVHQLHQGRHHQHHDRRREVPQLGQLYHRRH